MKPHFQRWLRFVVAASMTLTVFVIPSQAEAHSWSELNDWLDDWNQRYEEEWLTWKVSGEWEMSVSLEAVVLERFDMLERHPGWDGEKLDPPPDPEPDRHEKPEVEQESAPDPEPVVETVVVKDPSPEPPSTTVPPPGFTTGVEQWRSLVEAYFGGETGIALCIMEIESNGDPGAVNSRSGAAGLFQFIPSTWSGMIPFDLRGDVFDPETNVRAAKWLRDAEGWSQWSPWNRGSCH